MSRVGRLPAVMCRSEEQAAAGALTPRQLAELWVWVGYLGPVRGFTSGTTIAQYARSVSRLLEWSTDTGRDFGTLDANAFDEWQKWLTLTLGHSAVWRVRQVCAVRLFYHWRGSRLGLVNSAAAEIKGPNAPIGMPKKYSTAQLKGMLASTQSRKLEALRLRDAVLLLLLLSTGLRREEISTLSIRDLDIGQRTGVVSVRGKGSKRREVPFEGPVVDLLRNWLLMRESFKFPYDREAVFIGLVGIGRGCRLRPRAIERCVKVHAKHAGLREWGVHRFRVTFATTLYDDGAGIEEIRTLMGHESIETTRRYIAVSERSRRTRLKADRQHEVLGTRSTGRPRWMQAALGGSVE